MHSLQNCCSNKTLLKNSTTNLQLQQTTAENTSYKNRLLQQQSRLNFQTSKLKNLTNLQTHPIATKTDQEEEGTIIENVLH